MLNLLTVGDKANAAVVLCWGTALCEFLADCHLKSNEGTSLGQNCDVR